MTATILRWPWHILHRAKDCGADEGCAACQLSLCIVCKGFEGSLPTHCPGEPMDGNLQTNVYVDEIDYFNGQWRKKA